MSKDKQKINIGNEPVYDAKMLGAPKMITLGFQHMFAMFGATVLVPILTGLSVSTTLLFAGLGTLLFHLLTKRIVPAFLGSSFAYLAGYMAIAPNQEADLLPYACFAVAVSGILYLILSALFKVFGAKKVMRYFPPIVTGPIIISIGLILMPLPQMLKPITVSMAIMAMPQLAEQLVMAEELSMSPMEIMMGPVTIGGK